jgi:hypothetical protein
MESEHQEAYQKAIRELENLRRLPWDIYQIEFLNRAIKNLKAMVE